MPNVPLPPVDMPYHDGVYQANSTGIQVYLSAWTIQSALTSYLTVQPIAGWVNATDVPASSPVKLDTTSLNLLLPGISSFYGAGLPVDVLF